MLFVTAIVFATSAYQLGLVYEGRIKSILKDRYLELEAQYQQKNTATLSKCLEKNGIEKCVDPNEVKSLFNSFPVNQQEELLQAYDELMHSDIDDCPIKNSGNGLHRVLKRTFRESIETCIGISSLAIWGFVLIPPALSFPYWMTVISASYVYWEFSGEHEDRDYSKMPLRDD